jgi:hypothetical protein
MIIFIHEDGAYLAWLARHRQGLVVDWLRKPTRKHPVLHRATCSEIRHSSGPRSHWTTGRHLKACATDVDELREWVQEETDVPLEYCTSCQPNGELPGPAAATHAAGHDHLTHLGGEIVNYLLEVAVMFLDDVIPAYDVTVADVAQYVSKTPAQISAAIQRLLDDNYISLSRAAAHGRPNKAHVFPTAKALSTLPAFEAMDEQAIEQMLERLAAKAK